MLEPHEIEHLKRLREEQQEDQREQPFIRIEPPQEDPPGEPIEEEKSSHVIQL